MTYEVIRERRSSARRFGFCLASTLPSTYKGGHRREVHFFPRGRVYL